jgi:hypothetical protein
MDVSEREQYLAAIHGDRDAFEMITMHNGDGPFSGRCVAARGRRLPPGLESLESLLPGLQTGHILSTRRCR